MPWLDPLLIAVHLRCSKVVSKLLKSKRRCPDGPFKDFTTPLHLAVLNDDLTSVKHLIRHGADLNIPDHNGETPLHIAVAETTSLETFRELLKARPVLNIHDLDDSTPLHCACLEPDIDKIKELLQQPNPPVNDKDDEGATPMHLLVHVCEKSEEVEVIKIIKRAYGKGFHVNAQTHAGETILHVASQGVNRENLIYELLKLDGIDATMQDENGDNFLHAFLQYRLGFEVSEELLCILLEEDNALIKKHDLATILNQRNDEGSLPVTVYIKGGCINSGVAKRFLDYVPNIDVQNNIGQSILHLITQSALYINYKRQVLRHAIQKNADVNVKDNFGRTPIFFANDFSVVKIFVENGANVNATDQCKRTPLMATLPCCNPRVCQFLINRGSRINMRDKFGHTALHYAAWENRVRELEVLLRNGADVFAKDKVGRSPHDIACYWRCRDAVDILGNAMLMHSKKNGKTKRKAMSTSSFAGVALWVDVKRFVLPRDCHGMTDIKKYFDIPIDVEKYFQRVLQTPGIGLPGKVDESPWIESIVLRIIKEIALRIGDVDQRFKCSVFRSGSTFEGTKIDDPDEFDFLFVLERFSEIIEVKKNFPTDHPVYGFESVSGKSEKMDAAYQRYFDHQQSLLCGRLRHDFFLLVSRILFSKHIWVFDEVFTDTFSISNLPNKPVVNFKIYLVSAFYKGISVSIDVVPALRLKNWRPDGTNLDANVIIPKTVLSKHFLLLCQWPEYMYARREGSDRQTLFRISCAPFEIELMQSLPGWIRQSYALAKMMKGNFMCPRIQIECFADEESGSPRYISAMASEEISSYMLKNCLFHVLASQPDLLQSAPLADKSLLYNSVALALNMYEYLGQAAEAKRLPVYFLPHLDLFKEHIDVDDETSSEDGMDVNKIVEDKTFGKEYVWQSSCEKIKSFCDLLIKLYSL